ncbi:MAG: hypothetical protein U0936_03600 [Planctomycetaceae bacterium]
MNGIASVFAGEPALRLNQPARMLVMTTLDPACSLCLTQFGDLGNFGRLFRELPPGAPKVVTARILDRPEQAHVAVVKQQIAKVVRRMLLSTSQKRMTKIFISQKLCCNLCNGTLLPGLRVVSVARPDGSRTTSCRYGRFREHETDVLKFHNCD